VLITKKLGNFYAKGAAPDSNHAENPWCLSCEFEKCYVLRETLLTMANSELQHFLNDLKFLPLIPYSF
jgi:hypothetical protein